MFCNSPLEAVSLLPAKSACVMLLDLVMSVMILGFEGDAKVDWRTLLVTKVAEPKRKNKSSARFQEYEPRALIICSKGNQ